MISNNIQTAVRCLFLLQCFEVHSLQVVGELPPSVADSFQTFSARKSLDKKNRLAIGKERSRCRRADRFSGVLNRKVGKMLDIVAENQGYKVVRTFMEIKKWLKDES